MLPDTPMVVVCPHCGKVDWLKNLVEVGEIPGPRGFGVPLPEYDLSFEDLPFIEVPTGDDYLGFIESTELIHDQEFYLRWMYWHLMNDARRKSSALLSTQDAHHSVAHISVKRIVATQSQDTVFLSKLLAFKPWLSHLDAQCLGLVGARHCASIVIRQHNDWDVS